MRTFRIVEEITGCVVTRERLVRAASYDEALNTREVVSSEADVKEGGAARTVLVEEVGLADVLGFFGF